MPMIKRHAFLCGGTGEMCGRSFVMMRDSLALFYKGLEEKLDILYETMDAGGEVIGEIIKILAADEELGFRDPHTRLAFLELAAKVKAKLQKNEEFNLMHAAPEWFRDELLLTKEELEFELDKGYGRNLILGSLVAGLALECAEGTKEDNAAGFKAVADEVVDSNGSYEVRVAFVGGGNGGEGRINLCLHPAILKSMCVDAVMENLHLQEDQAKQYVDRTLKIAVIMTGAAFRFPRISGLEQDVAGLVAGTLENYPENSARAVDAFYLLEHDRMPVQADKASYGGPQYKHAHAIEIVAFAALEDFFARTDEDFERLKNNPDDLTDKVPIIPHYSLPGHAKTNWVNLGVPEDYRRALSARLRFDAALFYWLRPQLELTSEQLQKGEIYASEFLCKMYGEKTARKLQASASYEELEEKVIKPFKILIARERQYLRWLKDIALTGTDWEKNNPSGNGSEADLFPVGEIIRMLENPDVSQCGGMTGFCLDRLTECEEGNEYLTKLTLDKARKLKYVENGKPRAFLGIMSELYDICADRRGRKSWLF